MWIVQILKKTPRSQMLLVSNLTMEINSFKYHHSTYDFRSWFDKENVTKDIQLIRKVNYLKTPN